MTTNTIQELIDTITVDGANITTPSYSVSAIPWTTGSTITWAPNAWTNTDLYTTTAAGLSQGGKLQLMGENADIEINGESLVSMLKRIEQRINLLTVNTELEAEWDELRELGEQYRALEQRIKDKMETWNKLKAQDNENR